MPLYKLTRWGHRAVIACALLLGLVTAAAASRPSGAAAPAPGAEQGSPQPAAQPGSEESDAADTDTPRRALERFLGSARAGNLSQAADELWQISQDVEEMAQLARKLQAVLDRRLPFDKERLDKVADLPNGSKSDGMAEQEEVGRIEMPLGSEPVRLVRKRNGDGSTHWVFSARTVSRIPAWYERLEDHWLLDHLPDALQVTGVGGLLYWQWLALPVVIVLSALLGFLFSVGLRIVLRIGLHKRELALAVLERQVAPLRLLGAALALRWLLLSLFITAAAEQTVRGLCNVVLITGVMFCLWRAADVLAHRARQSTWISARPALIGVMPLLHRIVELCIWSVAILWSLQELGYSVTAVLASLGLGGLAVALAAKNTLEHLLGGMTLSLDQPMRVGDQVKIGDVQGNVEQIGIRSTRIRTQDRSVVTIPNGKLADLNIETLAARDRLRMAVTLNISSALKPDKLRELREGLLGRIREQPLIYKEKLKVNYTALTESVITLEIVCWFETGDSEQFAESRQNLLLSLLEVVDAFGALAGAKPAGAGAK